MAKFPAMPLWTDAYLADTRHLTRDEHGAYFLLLMEAWRRPTCRLPDDDALLARLALATPEEWALLKPKIMAMWTFDGRSREWHQKRQKKERDYLKVQSRLQSHRATKRWNKTKKYDAAAMPDRCRIDAPTPTPTPTRDSSESVTDSESSSTNREGCGERAPASPVAGARAPRRARKPSTRRPRTPLPTDFGLTEERRTVIETYLNGGPSVMQRFEAFCDWAGEFGLERADWDLTLKNWCKRTAAKET